MIVDDTEILDEKLMSEMFKFYSQLFCSKFSSEDCPIFFNCIAKYIPKVNSFKQACDNQITIAELDAVIGHLSLNKAPGSDGLTGDFYQHFWLDIRELLHKVFTEIFESCELTPTMRHGIIVFIPKPGKDSRFLENRRLRRLEKLRLQTPD